MLSRRARYALKALVFLGECGPAGASVTRIAQELAAAPAFISPILLELRRKGLLVSFRGRAGGYALARSPDRISFAEVVGALEGAVTLADCAESGAEVACDGCRSAATCPVRPALVEARLALMTVLERTMLAVEPPSPAPSSERPGARRTRSSKPVVENVQITY